MVDAKKSMLPAGKRLKPCHAFTLLVLFFCFFHTLSDGSVKKSSKKKEMAAPQAENSSKAPVQTRKTVEVLSDFEESLVLPVIKRIEEETGLTCRLTSGTPRPDTAFDLFLGSRPRPMPEDIVLYSSKAWEEVNPSLHDDGVYTWSFWFSCVALNTILHSRLTDLRAGSVEAKGPGADAFDAKVLEANVLEANLLEALVGKLTAVDPRKDPFTGAVFTALYSEYGRPIIAEITDAIPVYRNSRDELVFSVESGQYAAALGAEGYFRGSILKRYPLDLIYGSLNREKYPVTTVYGRNVTFIPGACRNQEGAQFLIDFLVTDEFQTFLEGTVFTPFGKALGTPHPPLESLLEWEHDEAVRAEALRAWEELAYPANMREIVP